MAETARALHARDVMMLTSLLGNSQLPAYVKITATALLALTYIGALAVAAETYVTEGPNATLPTIVALVLGTGVGMALNVLGLHSGASITEGAASTTSTTTTTVAPSTTATTTKTERTSPAGGA